MVPMKITKEFSYKASNQLLMAIFLEDICFNTKWKTIVLIAIEDVILIAKVY